MSLAPLDPLTDAQIWTIVQAPEWQSTVDLAEMVGAPYFVATKARSWLRVRGWTCRLAVVSPWHDAHWQRWTREDDAYLIAGYPVRDIVAIAEHLGRTVSAVQLHVNKLRAESRNDRSIEHMDISMTRENALTDAVPFVRSHGRALGPPQLTIRRDAKHRASLVLTGLAARLFLGPGDHPPYSCSVAISPTHLILEVTTKSPDTFQFSRNNQAAANDLAAYFGIQAKETIAMDAEIVEGRLIATIPDVLRKHIHHDE